MVGGAGFTVAGAMGDTAGAIEGGGGTLEKRSCDEVRTRAWFDEGKLAG